MRLLATLIFLASAISAHGATQIHKYDADAIDSSIKCELGTVAKALAAKKIPSSRMMASITISGTETINKKLGVSLKFPNFMVFKLPQFDTNYEQQTKVLRSSKGNRNIHFKNGINCRKSFVVSVGIIDCFKEQSALFRSGDTITCESETMATSTANASGGFGLWTVNVGPSGSLSKTRVWKISITAPPEKK